MNENFIYDPWAVVQFPEDPTEMMHLPDKPVIDPAGLMTHSVRTIIALVGYLVAIVGNIVGVVLMSIWIDKLDTLTAQWFWTAVAMEVAVFVVLKLTNNFWREAMKDKEYLQNEHQQVLYRYDRLKHAVSMHNREARMSIARRDRDKKLNEKLQEGFVG